MPVSRERVPRVSGLLKESFKIDELAVNVQVAECRTPPNNETGSLVITAKGRGGWNRVLKVVVNENEYLLNETH